MQTAYWKRAFLRYRQPLISRYAHVTEHVERIRCPLVGACAAYVSPVPETRALWIYCPSGRAQSALRQSSTGSAVLAPPARPAYHSLHMLCAGSLTDEKTLTLQHMRADTLSACRRLRRLCVAGSGNSRTLDLLPFGQGTKCAQTVLHRLRCARASCASCLSFAPHALCRFAYRRKNANLTAHESGYAVRLSAPAPPMCRRFRKLAHFGFIALRAGHKVRSDSPPPAPLCSRLLRVLPIIRSTCSVPVRLPTKKR